MEQSFSTSKVTVEYHDPHGLYDLLAPGLAARLPLRNLHWQSHAGPLRSIDTLHVELVAAGTKSQSTTDTDQAPTTAGPAARERRHQIPGLRRTPYLKVLLVRCDDNDRYKAQTRGEIREWLKAHTARGGGKSGGGSGSGGSSGGGGGDGGGGGGENHDAFEWLIVHVVLPNTAAYAQPRTNRAADGASGADGTATKSTASRWGKSPSTVLERLRADFNSSSGSSGSSSGAGSGSGAAKAVDRVAQIRLAVQDVPYELLPRAPVPAPGSTVAPGPGETARDTQAAWAALVDQFKTLILASFDVRVSQYEDDIREKDQQRRLPGWNFCTFFILKEGLARGFESVGLVEDALVGYDELSVGLDTVVQEHQAAAATDTTRAGAFLASTDDLAALARRAAAGTTTDADRTAADRPPISAAKKPYRELILANNVSVFDFRCYLFARQVALLLRLASGGAAADDDNADSTGEAVEHQNLAMLAAICRRTLAFLPAVAQVLREDLLHALADDAGPVPVPVVDNVVASFAFSVAQQILAQTATKALPIPLHGLASDTDTAIPEPTATMHPMRSSSLSGRGAAPPPSPGVFPGPGQQPPKGAAAAAAEAEGARFLKRGLEELAARRADLYMLSRNILEDLGKKRGWASGWADAPFVGEGGAQSLKKDEEALEEVSLDDDDGDKDDETKTAGETPPTLAGADNALLRAALASETAFYRLYEALTDKALRHYTVAGHAHAVHASLADLAVLHYHRGAYAAAAAFFHEATPFFGETGWSRLELALLAMYARCLRATGRTDEFVLRLVKLLTKAARAERDGWRRGGGSGVSGGAPSVPPRDQHDLAGYVAALLAATAERPADLRIPLAHFVGDVAVVGSPVYADGQDRVGLTLRLHSFLAEALPVDTFRARMVATSRAGGVPREIWLEAPAATVLQPGRNKIELFSNTIIPGVYEINQLKVTAGKLLLVHDRHPTTPAAATATAAADDAAAILKEPHVVLFQHASSLDVRLATARDLQLHKNNALELALLTGWNDVQHCEVRVRAATGGLRLLLSEAKVVGDDGHTLHQPVEGGVLRFGALPPHATVTTAFPFSIEQDALDLCVRVEVTYTTAHGVFFFAKAPAVSTALALGVNVQDVFKHDALFCRFTVSTASASPLRVFASELADSDLFAAQSAGLPDDKGGVVAFPKQPVSLLYRIRRKPRTRVDGAGAGAGAGAGGAATTLYIKLRYSVLLDEIEARLQASLAAAFRGPGTGAGAGAGDGTALAPYARLATACVLRRARAALAPLDLERAALVGALPTAFLAGTDWAAAFPGLGPSVAAQLAAFLAAWLEEHPLLPLPPPATDPAADPATTRTILIPVDIPSVTVVHTADIQLQGAPASLIPYVPPRLGRARAPGSDDADDRLVRMPIFSVNQLLPATLHLKWTRLWDTSGGGGGTSGGPSTTDLEFSFEVTAPPDTWLIGGRRKGHFVIPAPTTEPDEDENEDGDGDDAVAAGRVGWASTPACEAAIPLMLIPLREGHLPYPSVEIREVVTAADGGGQHHHHHHHEADYRNVGETVHVVADRREVTLSLDASGPGGGPLVLKSERTVVEGRVVV